MMKKLLPLLCITCVFLSGCFQEKTYHYNGNLKSIGSLKDGKKEGEWKYYHKNGELKDVGSYKLGKREGEWKTYRDNGNLKSIGSLKDGKREGEWKWYYKNGKLEWIDYHKDGKREGEWKFYKENGKLEMIKHYKNGKLINIERPEKGLIEKVFENGKLEKISHYKNGKLIKIERPKKGLTKIEKVFEKEKLVWNKEPLNGSGFVDENNKKTGEWKYYDEYGEVFMIHHYKNGEIIKTQHIYYYSIK